MIIAGEGHGGIATHHVSRVVAPTSRSRPVSRCQMSILSGAGGIAPLEVLCWILPVLEVPQGSQGARSGVLRPPSAGCTGSAPARRNDGDVPKEPRRTCERAP